MSKQEESVDEVVSLNDIIASMDLSPEKEETPSDTEEKEVEKPVVETEKKEESKEENLLSQISEEKEEVEKEIAEQPETQQVKENPVFEKAKFLIENGYIDDMLLQEEGDEEGEGIKLSELESITEDQLKTIIDTTKKEKEALNKERYIPKEKLAEDALKINDILQSGGQLSDIFEKPEDAIRPFQGRDLSNKEDLAHILFYDYTVNKGFSQKKAVAILKTDLEEGRLEEEALSVYKQYNDAYDRNLDTKRQEALDKAQERQRLIQENRKALKETLKKDNFKESVSIKFIDAVTKRDSSGKLEIEKKFKDILDNPSENYQKLLYLFDENIFNQVNNIKTQKKEGLKTLKILGALPKSRSTELATNKEEVKDDLFSQISQINLK